MSPRRRQEGDDDEPAALDAHDHIALRRKVRAQTSTRRPDLRKRSDTNRVKKSSPQAEQLSNRPKTSNKDIKALVVPLDKCHERVSHTAWQALQGIPCSQRYYSMTNKTISFSRTRSSVSDACLQLRWSQAHQRLQLGGSVSSCCRLASAGSLYLNV